LWYLVAKETICVAIHCTVSTEEVLGREYVCVIFGKICHYLQMFSQKKDK